jgi:hypothetical protein
MEKRSQADEDRPAPCMQQCDFWYSTTMGGDVRVDIYHKNGDPLAFYIIPKDEAHGVAARIVALAGRAN